MFGRKEVLVQIEANLTWEVGRDESGTYIGICRPLNMNATGDTYAQFLEAANETTALLLADLFQENELETFLRKQGWIPVPLPAPGTHVRFDVPFNVQRRNRIEDLNLVPA
ncbi:MAG TPA: hypothetical protein VN674_13870 [Gemmatimonadales bacterium]|nr:hypothetical protein [Gemmatimonadales bacterium]